MFKKETDNKPFIKKKTIYNKHLADRIFQFGQKQDHSNTHYHILHQCFKRLSNE